MGDLARAASPMKRGDFHEEDEPVAAVTTAFDAGEPFVTTPPTPGANRAPGCTCPELYAGLNPTGCHNLSRSCRVHGAGTPDWDDNRRRANERLRAAWAEVHAARARRGTL